MKSDDEAHTVNYRRKSCWQHCHHQWASHSVQIQVFQIQTGPASQSGTTPSERLRGWRRNYSPPLLPCGPWLKFSLLWVLSALTLHTSQIGQLFLLRISSPTHLAARTTHITSAQFAHTEGVCEPMGTGCVSREDRSLGAEEGGRDPGTHQSLAGTEGCGPDAGTLLQHCAPEMARGCWGSHHLHVGKVPVPPLQDIAFGKKSLINRQVEEQVLLLVWNSVVHPVLWAIHFSLPPAVASDGMVQAIGQKVPPGIYSDWSHHVVLGQGLEKMLWKKRRQRMRRWALSAESTARSAVWNLACWGQNTTTGPTYCTNTVNSEFPEQLQSTRGPSLRTRGSLSRHPGTTLEGRCFPRVKLRWIHSWGVLLAKGQGQRKECFKPRVLEYKSQSSAVYLKELKRLRNFSLTWVRGKIKTANRSVGRIHADKLHTSHGVRVPCRETGP